MRHKEATHLLFPSIQDLEAHGSNRYTANFVNDESLYVYIENKSISTDEVTKLLETIKADEYVLWVDDKVSPYATKHKHLKENHPIIIVACSIRAAYEVLDKIGFPSILYLDYHLDDWRPVATGLEVIYEISYKKHGFIPEMIPISSEKSLNQKLVSTWNELIKGE